MRAPVHDLHISNLLTYGSLAASVCAVAAALGGNLSLAGALIAGAALSDTFDGAFARLFARTDRQARAGGQLDSLVDAVAFGLAPVVVLTALPDRPVGLLVAGWWLGAGTYVLATVTRLAFYNVEGNDALFVGIPTPAAALIWSTTLLYTPSAAVVTGLLFVCGAAMVAPLPIRRPRGLALGAFGLWALGLVLVHLIR